MKAFFNAATSLEDPTENVLKSANWARSMLSSELPVGARVSFALEAESAQRVEYAATYNDGQVDGVSWRSLKCFVDTVDIPSEIPWKEFSDTVAMVAKNGLRKQVNMAANK